MSWSNTFGTSPNHAYARLCRIPLAALLLEQSAGLMQIAAFVSTLMMVGVITFPVEQQVFGTPVAAAGNELAFLFALVVAGAMALVLGGPPRNLNRGERACGGS